MRAKLAAMALAALAVDGAMGDTWTDPDTGITWTYTVLSDGKASLGGGSSSSTAIPTSTTGALSIPSMLDVYPVVDIGNYAFDSCSGLTDVTIPDGVTNIGSDVFFHCWGLTSVTIPNSVTNIGSDAFGDCMSLTGVTIPDGMMNIGDGAFCCCNRLASVTIPDSVTNIGDYAFSYCSGLTSVTIGNGVTNIGDFAFGECSGLTNITVGMSNPSYKSVNGLLLSKDGTTLIQGVNVNGEVTIPNGVTRIVEYAFIGCDGLTSVTLPDGMMNIGEDAFHSCSGLTDVTIPDSVTNIGISAFQSCNGLTSVTIGNSVTSIGSDAFCNCRGLTNIIFAGNAPSGANYAFYEVASGCCAYVRRDSTGWGVDIPGTWNGIAIDYLPEVEDQYVVIDLSGGTNATSYPVSYLANVPSGGWTDEYKTTKLVLRKIDGGTFMMCGSKSTTISQPFYIGVFEVTQKQWELVMGTKPSYFNNSSCYAARPVEQVSYDMIRGSSDGAGWPESSAVDGDSFLGRLRARAGIDIDLPTEAQWEYSCRAGAATDFNNGRSRTGENNDTNLNEVARYQYNGGAGSRIGCTTVNGTAEVGTYRPNAWGLYDMHGNVWEWCLDWHGDTLAGGADPKGPIDGYLRVMRGGGWDSYADECVSSHRIGEYSLGDEGDSGFRICCPVPRLLHISGAEVTLVTNEVAYTGNACEPGIESVTFEGTALVEGVDYLLSYANNTNAGIATVTLTGTNLYDGTYTTNFMIRPKPLTEWMVGAIGNHPYTGKAQTPKPPVTDAERGATLCEDEEYTLSYANNTAIGEGIVTVEGKGNYTGSIARAFVIEPSVGSELEEKLGGAGKVESDDEGGWKVTITNDIDSADLPIEIPDNIGPVTIDLNGHDLVGPDGEPAIRIVPGDGDGAPTELTIINSADGDATVQGGEGSPAIVVDDGTQDGVVINIGEGVVVRSGGEGVPGVIGEIGINEGVVLPYDLTDAMVGEIGPQPFTGEEVTPEVTVYDDIRGVKLVEGTDYVLAWEDNVRPGVATVTVTGKGSYMGEVARTFTIGSPVKATLRAGWYFKATLSELGYEVPTNGTAYSVKAYGLPAGLKLMSNKAVTKKVKVKGKWKKVVVTPAKSEWWIEGVPTAALDFFTNPPYLVIAANGVTQTLALPMEVLAQEVTELDDLGLGQSINTNGWLAGVGAGWTVAGLPTGLKYTAKLLTKTKKKGKKVISVTTNALPYSVYGKTTKAGLFTIMAKKKVGSFYETMKYRVLVTPKAPDTAVFGEKLTNITTMAYVPVEWDLTGGSRSVATESGSAGGLALPVVPTVAKVAGLPKGLTFAAANTFYDKKGTRLKQYAQTIVGTPTKPGTYVVTFTRNVKSGKKTIAKTAQILWKVTPNDAELSLGFNDKGGVIEGGSVGLKYGDLLAFSATSNATVKASGLPAGIKLVRVDGSAGDLALPGEAVWGFEGFTAKAGTYLVTVTATLSGNTVTQRIALKVDGLPSWAKGTFNGYVAGADGATNGLATVSVKSDGKISGKFGENGTNWTLSAACYTGAARPEDSPHQGGSQLAATETFTCSNVVAKYSYKVKEKVKGKLKTVTKTLVRTFALTVAQDPDNPVRGVAAMVEGGGSPGGLAPPAATEIDAWQNLWGSTYKAVGMRYFWTSKKKPYRAFSYSGATEAGAAIGLTEKMTLSLKVTSAGAVTATLSFDTGTFKKGKAVIYKPTCSTAVIPTSAADAVPFTGETFLYFAPSPGNSFPGYVACVPMSF